MDMDEPESEIKAEIVEVTPEQAKHWLGLNHQNRHLHQPDVDRHRREMVAGRWHVHSAIVFGRDGLLYDGQHRLEAVAQSGVSVWMLVVTGVPEDARITIDTGRKRSVGDHLKMVRGDSAGKPTAAVANLLVRWAHGDLVGNGFHPSASEQLAVIDRFQDIIAAAVTSANRLPRGHRNSALGAMYCWAVISTGTDAEVSRFFQLLEDGCQPRHRGPGTHPARPPSGQHWAPSLHGNSVACLPSLLCPPIPHADQEASASAAAAQR